MEICDILHQGQLLSLIGKLTFISRVVKSGRTFLRRLIDRAKRTRYLHHRVSLDQATRQDIEWWIQYLPTWNGISVFCDSLWSSNGDLHLWTDASDTGIGGFFGSEWFSVMFTESYGYMKDMSITWRELYALLVAKLDLEDAYKHIFIRPEDCHLLGCILDRHDGAGITHNDNLRLVM